MFFGGQNACFPVNRQTLRKSHLIPSMSLIGQVARLLHHPALQGSKAISIFCGMVMVSKMSNGFSAEETGACDLGCPCPERPQVKQHELETTEELESQGWLVHGCRGTNHDNL